MATDGEIAALHQAADASLEADRADALRWRALVAFWRESEDPTDIANTVADLVEMSPAAVERLKV